MNNKRRTRNKKEPEEKRHLFTTDIRNKAELVNFLTPIEALNLLKKLTGNDATIQEKVLEAILEKIKSQDELNAIYQNILSRFEEITEEHIWHRTGEQEDGKYEYFDETLGELLEEILNPYIQKISLLKRLEYIDEAEKIRKAVRKALIDYEHSWSKEIEEQVPDGIWVLVNDMFFED